MSKKGKTSEGLVAAVWSAFQSLLRLLRIPVPLACAICVAVMLGTSTVKVQSIEFTRVLAAVASVIVLIVVYLGAYRAALVLLCLLDETQDSGDQKKFDALCVRIRGESSLQNPFSSTQVSNLSRSCITDYVGLVVIHLPMLVVLVCCFWTLSEERAQTTTVLAAMEERKAALADMNAAGDDVASLRKAAQRVRESLDEANESWIGLMSSSVYNIAALAFVFLYFEFLCRIAEIIFTVNYFDDQNKRLIILFVSFVVTVIPLGILHLVWVIQSARFFIRLCSM